MTSNNGKPRNKWQSSALYYPSSNNAGKQRNKRNKNRNYNKFMQNRKSPTEQQTNLATPVDEQQTWLQPSAASQQAPSGHLLPSPISLQLPYYYDYYPADFGQQPLVYPPMFLQQQQQQQQMYVAPSQQQPQDNNYYMDSGASSHMSFNSGNMLIAAASNRNQLIKTTQQEQTNWAPSNLTTTPEREHKLMQKMQISIEKLKRSGFFAAFLNQMLTSEASFHLRKVTDQSSQHNNKVKMVIYGIGSIWLSKSSKLQLSLAILMKQQVDWIGDVEVFDPVISLTELKVIEQLGCCVLSVDEECQSEAVNPILFFMPFLEVELYENLLMTNWRHDMLNRIIILGNSLKSQARRNHVMTHINAIQPFTKEFEICKLSKAYVSAFEGLSWHCFSLGCDDNLPYPTLPPSYLAQNLSYIPPPYLTLSYPTPPHPTTPPILPYIIPPYLTSPSPYTYPNPYPIHPTPPLPYHTSYLSHHTLPLSYLTLPYHTLLYPTPTLPLPHTFCRYFLNSNFLVQPNR